MEPEPFNEHRRGPEVDYQLYSGAGAQFNNVSVNSSINYTARFTSTSLSYTRGTNGGAGYLIGADVDTVAGNFSKQFGLNLTIGLTGGYERTAGLNNDGVTDGVFGGAQGTWRIGRDIIVFANYTGTDQIVDVPHFPQRTQPSVADDRVSASGFRRGQTHQAVILQGVVCSGIVN